MTILQLKYVIVIASSSSMREAASRLYVSQPALSATIRDLEEELGIKIFKRTNKGVSMTNDGIEFLSYAKQAVSQYEIIEERYGKNDKEKIHFSVSTQHYVFAVNAFIETIKYFSYSKYLFSIHETKTDEVLGSVRDLKSEIGIVSYSNGNENIMKKLFREYQLEFYPLMTKDTYVYVWKDHPLAGLTEASLEDFSDYPCIAFDQNSEKEFYLSEEALGDYDFDKMIKSNDRATSVEMLVGLNGYSIGTGIMAESMGLANGYVCIKLKEEDPLTIGYIVRKNHKFSEVGERYIEELNKYRE